MTQHHLRSMLIKEDKMAKKTIVKKESKIEDLAEKLGIKKENLEYGLKTNKEKITKAIQEAAKFMGVK